MKLRRLRSQIISQGCIELLTFLVLFSKKITFSLNKTVLLEEQLDGFNINDGGELIKNINQKTFYKPISPLSDKYCRQKYFFVKHVEYFLWGGSK